MIKFKFLMYILFFLTIFKIENIKSDEDLYKFDFSYFTHFTLLNSNFIIFSNKGFFTFNSNFKLLYNYTFSTALTLDIETKKNYPSFTQFSEEEGGLVLCYILKNVYIFNDNGEFVYLTDANEASLANLIQNNYIINAYKRENSEYYYLVIYIDNSLFYGIIHIFYYKINIVNFKKDLVNYNTHSNENENIGYYYSICCEKMIANNNNNYIACFYQYSKYNSLVIGEITFEPDNNFTYIEPRKYFNLTDSINVFEYPSSITNDDKTKVYICFSASSTNASCFYYDINKKEFSKIHYFGYKCKSGLYSSNLQYFRETNEFIFSCVYSVPIYSIIKFRENITLIQPNSYGTYNITNICYYVNSYSILYSLQDKEYILFSSAICDQNTNNIYYFSLANFLNTTNIGESKTDLILEETNIKIPKSNEISSSIIITKTTGIISSTEITKPTEISPSITISKSSLIFPSTKIIKTTGITSLNKIIKKTGVNLSYKILESFAISLSTKISESTGIFSSTKITESIQIIIPKTSLLTEINKQNQITLNDINKTEIIESSQINILNKKTNILKNSYIEGCNDSKKIFNEKNECICNNEKGYYYIKNNNYNKIIDDKCYNDKTKPKNYYLNKQTKLYEICHRNCLTCNNNGNENENNCTSCVNGYIFTPDIENTMNCVPKCQYLYYYNFDGFYSCTKNYQCPLEAYLLIRKKNKCIDNCSKDNIYKYQYSGECYEKCPNETNTNGYKCEVKNINSCSLSNIQLNLTIDDIIENNIDSYTKNYVEEFNYTNKQIINYMNKEYSLVLYKDSSCIKELPLTVPQIDFGECYKKIKKEYKIEEELLIAILDKYIGNENPKTTYLLFNPINGERIDENEICKNDTIIIKENILTLPGVEPELIKFFASQDINVFNTSDKFYTDICKHYISPNERDIPLNLRIQIFYPNVSLCDENCMNKGVNLKEMESICYCPFNDLSKNIFLLNTLKFAETFDKIYSFITISNINVLFCIKVLFQIEHLKRSIGGLIILILMFLQTICVIIYKIKSKLNYKRFIFNISNNYKQSLLNSKKASPLKKHNKNININNSNKTKTNINLSSNSLNNMTYLTKYSNNIIIKNIKTENNLNKTIYKKGKYNNKNNNKTHISEYLLTDPNDMEYDDVLEKDKRTFFQYFFGNIKKKQLIINTFFIVDNIKPKTIKIVSFLLKLDFYLLFNGLIYSEEFLIELYKNEKKNTFINFISRHFSHLLYIFIIIKVLDEFIECFFIEEKRLKGIFIRGKNKMKKIKENLVVFIKKIEKYYFYLITISYFIMILSIIYISCFNDVYYYTRKEWIKSSLLFFIIIQIASIFIILFETIIRYIGIKLKNEKIFKLSKIIL